MLKRSSPKQAAMRPPGVHPYWQKVGVTSDGSGDMAARGRSSRCRSTPVVIKQRFLNIFRLPMGYKRMDGAVGVSQPQGVAEAFKRLALDRTADRDPKCRRRRVWAQDLYEEAIRALLDRLARGEKVVFVATPVRRKEQKTVRLEPALWTQVQDVAARYDVPSAAVVRTALLAFLESHGIALD